MPKVSVIVPVYNVEKYIGMCIESILKQSFPDFEIILVDDGSRDNSGIICDKYATEDSRVRVLHQPNGGVTSARCNGVKNAKGEWITFVDADDTLPVDALKTIEEKKISSICMNDTPYCSDREFEEMKETIIKTMENKFPQKSLFEI